MCVRACVCVSQDDVGLSKEVRDWEISSRISRLGQGSTRILHQALLRMKRFWNRVLKISCAELSALSLFRLPVSE
jgi:hypothetical protein